VSLRAVIFGLEGIFFRADLVDSSTGFASERRDAIVNELTRLWEYLRSKGIKPIVLTNRDWKFTPPSGAVRTVDDYLTGVHGEHTLYVAARGNVPRKPREASVGALLEREGLRPEEVIYVGMSDIDFRTAVNSNLLFLNAVWDRQEVEHGFVFESPLDIMKFIDLFALREPFWFYAIDEPIVLRSLGPYSTLNEESRAYSAAAEAAAKRSTEDRYFFLNSVVASLYFSGLIQRVNYIGVIPGHSRGFGNPTMDAYLATVGNIFRKNYLRDLIDRHTDAASSRAVRRAGGQPRPETQFNTLRLTRKPLKKGEERYSSALNLRGKTVLVFDDFCTNGMSFEAARHLLHQAGAATVQVSWLKAINRGYRVVGDMPPFNPYQIVTHDPASIRSTELPYHTYVVAQEARTELSVAFEHYRQWTPPV
jgi:hypothetical protein